MDYSDSEDETAADDAAAPAAAASSSTLSTTTQATAHFPPAKKQRKEINLQALLAKHDAALPFDEATGKVCLHYTTARRFGLLTRAGDDSAFFFLPCHSCPPTSSTPHLHHAKRTLARLEAKRNQPPGAGQPCQLCCPRPRTSLNRERAAAAHVSVATPASPPLSHRVTAPHHP